jgi:hypothetical protein
MVNSQEKEMMNLIVAMYQLSGESHGEVFKKLPEKEQTVLRSIVFSKLFFNMDAHTILQEQKENTHEPHTGTLAS